MSLLVALNRAMIFINIVGTSATQDSFIFNFLVGVLIVIVTIPQAYIFLKISASDQVVVFYSQVEKGKVFLVIADVGIYTRVKYLGVLEFKQKLTSTKHGSIASQGLRR